MSEEQMKKGGISVDTEHIFPVIKRWLYSDKEIFLRELISNCSDAIDKLYYKGLKEGISGLTRNDFAITVKADKENRTLTVSDNGIGMTAEELENNKTDIFEANKRDLENAIQEVEEKKATLKGETEIGEINKQIEEYKIQQRKLESPLLWLMLF